MFENRTYETILNRMLSRVKAQCGQIDTREGSIGFILVRATVVV